MYCQTEFLKGEKKFVCQPFLTNFCIFSQMNYLCSKTRNYLARLLLDYTYTLKHLSEGKVM